MYVSFNIHLVHACIMCDADTHFKNYKYIMWIKSHSCLVFINDKTFVSLNFSQTLSVF